MALLQYAARCSEWGCKNLVLRLQSAVDRFLMEHPCLVPTQQKLHDEGKISHLFNEHSVGLNPLSAVAEGFVSSSRGCTEESVSRSCL